MECAHKHVIQATEEIDAAEKILRNKLTILDRLAAVAKERVNVERDKIIEQADTERDQALIQIDELHEQLKRQIQDKNTRLHQLPLDRVSSFITSMTHETEELNENNEQLFYVICTPSKIQVQQKNSLSRNTN